MVSPLEISTIISYNSTKDYLLNAQTSLKDKHTETSKGGQVRANWGGDREKSSKEPPMQPGNDAARQSGVHCRAQPKEGKEQRHLVSTKAK